MHIPPLVPVVRERYTKEKPPLLEGLEGEATSSGSKQQGKGQVARAGNKVEKCSLMGNGKRLVWLNRVSVRE